MAKKSPKGLGGWITIFVISQLLGMMIVGTSLLDTTAQEENLDVLFEIAPAAMGSVAVEGFIQIAYLALGIIGMFLILIRSRSAPGFWRFTLFLLLIAVAINFINLQNIGSQVRINLNGPQLATAEKAIQSASTQALGGAVSTLLWLWYWMVSKRVRNTFQSPKPAQGVKDDDRKVVETFGSASEVPGEGQQAESGGPPARPPVAARDPFRGRPTRDCPRCGQRILATAEFCRHCKQAVEATVMDSAARQSPAAAGEMERPAGETAPASAPPDSPFAPPPPTPPAPEEPSSP